LHDLRRLYPIAHEAELAWVILLQGALAVRDTALIATIRPIQEEAQHRWQWLRTRIKESSPQVLAT
ncbi:MAG: molybdopterin oxidoreductase, partial [Hamadaea sp.]|nr:molybdopterin oxidoreductase [Hamadaea sp.]